MSRASKQAFIDPKRPPAIQVRLQGSWQPQTGHLPTPLSFTHSLSLLLIKFAPNSNITLMYTPRPFIQALNHPKRIPKTQFTKPQTWPKKLQLWPPANTPLFHSLSLTLTNQICPQFKHNPNVHTKTFHPSLEPPQTDS
jgi:hypothetical protein